MTAFNHYTDIFDVRGRCYHAAMLQYPAARDAEFALAVDYLAAAPGQRVADVPAGGGYLQGYLPDEVTVINVETSMAFAASAHASGRAAVLGTLDALPLGDGAVDRIISLAALHHVPDKAAFFRDAWRALAPGGALIIGDVPAGSPVSGFLESCVDRFTVTGHRGEYIDDELPAQLAAAGFAIERSALERYRWCFPDARAMVDYCQLLFGMERAAPADVAAGLNAHLEHGPDGGHYALGWELIFCRALKE